MSRAGGGGAGGVVRQGHLRKLKTMKRKYFVLRAETAESTARLEYYESEKKYRAGAVPRRVISLKSCFNITRRLDLKQPYVIALYLKEECFCIVMDKDEDLRLWLADLLKCHRADDSSEQLLHPTQHVWQVNVQKKGLGVTRTIQGLYNLCLTDKTLTLVKIRPNNNITLDGEIPDRIEFSLRNIRRCGDSECFFYMEVGRQTSTGPGELWMHTEDANIAQSMHSTIYHAMTNCAKDKDDRDLQPTSRLRSVSATDDPRSGSISGRRKTFSDSKPRSGVPSSFAINDQPSNNSLIQTIDPSARHTKHSRTFSLPTGCEPLKICHERTRSAPLTGDEVDRVVLEKVARHSSYKAVNGVDVFIKKWNRRDSTGTKFPKSSPGHSKNMPAIRHRCESMPSRTCPPMETERTPSRLQSNHIDVAESRDEPDTAEWHPTPGIPEEPDESYLKMTPRDINKNWRSSCRDEMPPPSGAGDSGYVEVNRTLSPAASSGSVCSGTPSTDPRFSEYQLEHATSHIAMSDDRPSRTYSVGSRPAPRAPTSRDRAYSVGARAPPSHRPPAARSAPALPHDHDLMELDFSNNSPKAKMILSRTPPSGGFVTPRINNQRTPFKPKVDEYVDMSPRSGYVEMRPLDTNLIPHTPTSVARSPPGRILSKSPPVAQTPDGYVEMNYSKNKKQDRDRTPSRPISIATEVRDRQRSNSELSSVKTITPITSPQTPAEDIVRKKKNGRVKDIVTPLGSQTIFPLSLESPASDERQEVEVDELEDDLIHHPLTTVRELSEDGGKKSPDLGSPPHYVTIANMAPRTPSQPIAAPAKSTEQTEGLSCNPTATKCLTRLPETEKGGVNVTFVRAATVSNAARFNVGDDTSRKSPGPESSLNYASLVLEPKAGNPMVAPRTYTQIDFARSEKLNTADAN